MALGGSTWVRKRMRIYLLTWHLVSGPPIEKISYKLEERGYPETGRQNVHDLCPELTWTAKKLRVALQGRKDITHA
jgi:hypothetical protein